jgi:thiol-disulfide isomerase/thioredoxin
MHIRNAITGALAVAILCTGCSEPAAISPEMASINAEEPISPGAKAAVMIDGIRPGEWTMDLDAAKSYAASNDVPVLLFFTGSDWCKYCKKTQEQIFTKEIWREYALDRLAMVYIDIPKDNSLLPKKYHERNEAMKESYELRGVPSFILLDPQDNSAHKEFNLATVFSAPAFIRALNTAARYLPTGQARFLAALTEAERTNYLLHLDDFKSADKELTEWLLTKPKPDELGKACFAAINARLDEANEALEKAEREHGIETTRGTDRKAETLAHYASATRLIELAEKLRGAQENLDGLLLSHPLGTERDKTQTTALLERMLAIQKQISSPDHE